MSKSDKGVYKHIEESDLPAFTFDDLREFLAPAMKFPQPSNTLFRILPNGDWVRVK